MGVQTSLGKRGWPRASRDAWRLPRRRSFVWLGYLDVWRDGSIRGSSSIRPFPTSSPAGSTSRCIADRPGRAWPTRAPIFPTTSWGRGLRNEVRYVNIDRHRDWLLHDYHREAQWRGQGLWPNSRPGWDRMQPDFQAWLDNLDAEGIQLLVVTRVNPGEGATTSPMPSDSRSSAAGPTRTPNGSSPSTAWPRKIRSFAFTECGRRLSTGDRARLHGLAAAIV